MDTLLLGVDKKARVKWQEDDTSVAGVDTDSPLLQKLLTICVLANDAEYHPENTDENEGDPLEIALLRFARACTGSSSPFRYAACSCMPATRWACRWNWPIT
ncbi:MAG: hypothetical protein RQ826_08515 [Xanthomonadales bacterium]|nr:hypothetical protein [Xanthomonadales bacterium]